MRHFNNNGVARTRKPTRDGMAYAQIHTIRAGHCEFAGAGQHISRLVLQPMAHVRGWHASRKAGLDREAEI